MVINRLEEQPADVVVRLRTLIRKYPHFRLHDFKVEKWSDLHAKVIIMDRQKAVVGSSNLSRRGLLTNYELALLVEGTAATSVASVVDRLLSSEHVACIERR
jgi:cardiolipin synthase